MIVKKRCKCVDACAHNYGYDFKHKGQEYRKSCHTANKKLAERIALKVYNQTVGTRAGLAPDGPVTARLSELVAQYTDWITGAYPNSAERQIRPVQLFADFLEGDPPIVGIESFDLERWRTARAKDVARSTTQRDFYAVRSMFREAETWYPGLTSPCPKGWKMDDDEIQIFSDEDLLTAFAQLPPWLAEIARVTYECLPRISEVLTLTKHDVGPDWIWRRLKGGKRMRHAVSPELCAALRARLVRPGQVHIFETRSGKNGRGPWVRMQAKSVSSRYTYWFRKLEMPGFTHHTFRHTGITQMLDDGVNPRVIQKLAGWANLAMLQRYGHVRDREMLRAVTGNAAKLKGLREGAQEGTSGAQKGAHARSSIG